MKGGSFALPDSEISTPPTHSVLTQQSVREDRDGGRNGRIRADPHTFSPSGSIMYTYTTGRLPIVLFSYNPMRS